MHYYNISIGGYGGEVCWHSISKEAYNYFNENDEMLTEHILNENNDVPDYADLTDNGSKTWDELDNIDHEYYCDTEDSTQFCHHLSSTNRTCYLGECV